MRDIRAFIYCFFLIYVTVCLSVYFLYFRWFRFHRCLPRRRARPSYLLPHALSREAHPGTATSYTSAAYSLSGSTVFTSADLLYKCGVPPVSPLHAPFPSSPAPQQSSGNRKRGGASRTEWRRLRRHRQMQEVALPSLNRKHTGPQAAPIVTHSNGLVVSRGDLRSSRNV